LAGCALTWIEARFGTEVAEVAHRLAAVEHRLPFGGLAARVGVGFVLLALVESASGDAQSATIWSHTEAHVPPLGPPPPPGPVVVVVAEASMTTNSLFCALAPRQICSASAMVQPVCEK
jgi:hypothetical protein